MSLFSNDVYNPVTHATKDRNRAVIENRIYLFVFSLAQLVLEKYSVSDESKAEDSLLYSTAL